MDSQWLLGKRLDIQTLHHLLPDRNVCMCDTYGLLDQDFILQFKHLLFFNSREAEVSDTHDFISPPPPMTTWGGGGPRLIGWEISVYTSKVLKG